MLNQKEKENKALRRETKEALDRQRDSIQELTQRVGPLREVLATRDIKTSIILTAAFVIIALNLFNDKSKYCILPQSYRNLDTNMDGEITPDEIARAYKILKKSGKLPEQTPEEQTTSEQPVVEQKNKVVEQFNNQFKPFNPFDR